MYFAGSYVDPIYIVIFTLVAVFLILGGIVVILYRYLQVLRSIERATKQTSQNTEPIKRLPQNFLLLEVKDTDKTPAIDATVSDSTSLVYEYPSDVTQRIPDGTRYKAEELYRKYSGQLFANGTEPPVIEP